MIQMTSLIRFPMLRQLLFTIHAFSEVPPSFFFLQSPGLRRFANYSQGTLRLPLFTTKVSMMIPNERQAYVRAPWGEEETSFLLIRSLSSYLMSAGVFSSAANRHYRCSSKLSRVALRGPMSAQVSILKVSHIQLSAFMMIIQIFTTVNIAPSQALMTIALDQA
jgi:hypothetical protein